MTKNSRFSEQSTILGHDELSSEGGSLPQRFSTPAPQYQPPEEGSTVPTSTYTSVTQSHNEDTTLLKRSESPDDKVYPEAISPPMRPVPGSDAMKESYNSSPIAAQAPILDQRRLTDTYKEQPPETQQTTATSVEQKKKRRKICGLPLLWFILLVAVIIIAIILGVVLGVVFGVVKKRHHSSSNTVSNNTALIGGAIDPAYYSTQGAFNGSGVALTSVNFGVDGSIFLFYQKYTGEIQQMINRANGDWAFVTTVATNARNATPLSAVAYIVDSVATWHLFYLDDNNMLKQRTSTNSSSFQTNIWQDGPINDLNLKAYGETNELIGMQACYWGNYYGSAGDFNDGFTVSKSKPSTGMNLWYPSSANTFDQYVWTNGDSQWNKSDTWPGFNTQAGVACQSWESGTTMYLMLVDESDTMRIFWKDTNLNITSTAEHPIDKWTNTSVSVPGVYASSSLGYTDWLAYQSAEDYTLHGVNITWAAENTSISPAPNSTDSDGSGLESWAMNQPDAGIPGTHFAITGLDQASGGRTLALFYQNEGNGLRLGRRDSYEGDWSYNEVPVNDN